MKFVRNFKSLDQAKGKTLYSPTITKITENGQSKMLTKNLGKDVEIAVPLNASSLDTIVIKKKHIIHYNSSYGTAPLDKNVPDYYVLNSSDLLPLSSSDYNFTSWNASIGDVITNDRTISASWQSKVEIKTFYIQTNEGNHTYQYEDGMTWEQWWQSSYNTDGWTYSTTINVVINDNYTVKGYTMNIGTYTALTWDKQIQAKQYYYRNGNINWLGEITEIPMVSDEMPQSGFYLFINNSEYTDPFSYECLSNTTWAAWVDSKYNDGNFSIDETTSTIINNYFPTLADSREAVLKTDIIIADNTYYLDLLNGHSTICAQTVPTPCCFVPGTQITLANSSTKSIEDMQIGEQVLSYNVSTGQTYVTKVKRLIIKENVITMARVTTKNGCIVEMNEYHPLLTTEGWHSLTNHNGYATLTENDTLVTINGNSKIKSIERWISEPQTLYNLDVVTLLGSDTENDNYFANGIVAHNPVASPVGPEERC